MPKHYLATSLARTFRYIDHGTWKIIFDFFEFDESKRNVLRGCRDCECGLAGSRGPFKRLVT